jgi:Fe-S-cluster containining protein
MAIHLPIVPPAARAARPSGPSPARRFKGRRYLGFRCTDCGNCCTQTIVPVNATDVARLVEGTGLAVHKIVAFHAKDDFSSGADDLAYAVLDEGPRVMCLRRRETEEGDPCRFYGEGACTVYEHRPVTCRLWPFDVTVDASGRLAQLAVNDAVPCPYELDGDVAEQSIVSTWEQSERQDDRWHRQVAAWNRTRGGGTKRQFLAYLGFR